MKIAKLFNSIQHNDLYGEIEVTEKVYSIDMQVEREAIELLKKPKFETDSIEFVFIMEYNGYLIYEKKRDRANQ